MSYLGLDINVAIMAVYDSDGFPGIQIDAYGEERSGVSDYDQHSPYGFMSRPHDCDTDPEGNPIQGCTVFAANDGGKGYAWLGADPRVTTLLPVIPKGSSLFHGGRLKNQTWTMIDGKTGSQTTYVPYAIVDGVPTKAMSLQFNVDNGGNEAVSLIHGDGMAIQMVTSLDGTKAVIIKNASGNAYLEINNTGIVLNGQVTTTSGFDAGGETSGLLVKAEPLVALLKQLITIVAAINATTTGGPAAALESQLANLTTKFTRGA